MKLERGNQHIIILYRIEFFSEDIYTNIHVLCMLAIRVETINNQTQQTNKQPQWLIKIINTATNGLENIKAATLA